MKKARISYALPCLAPIECIRYLSRKIPGLLNLDIRNIKPVVYLYLSYCPNRSECKCE